MPSQNKQIEENLLRKADKWLVDNFGAIYMRIDQEKANQLTESLANAFKSYAAAERLDERKEVALDNYRGQTFSDSTNWRGKFEKFVENNEKRIKELQERITQ